MNTTRNNWDFWCTTPQPMGCVFLTAINRPNSSLVQYHHSRVCKIMFGEMHISTLRDIYLHRKYLTSFYRMRRHYPYPDKEMIINCLACGAIKRGSCECPVLPKSFYVFCGQKCSSEWNCKKYFGFDTVASHVCFDFHCKWCHEDYLSSAGHNPYP